jgi:hypothetical protein
MKQRGEEIWSREKKKLWNREARKHRNHKNTDTQKTTLFSITASFLRHVLPCRA